jgi:hypothetical protein
MNTNATIVKGYYKSCFYSKKEFWGKKQFEKLRFLSFEAGHSFYLILLSLLAVSKSESWVKSFSFNPLFWVFPGSLCNKKSKAKSGLQ